MFLHDTTFCKTVEKRSQHFLATLLHDVATKCCDRLTEAEIMCCRICTTALVITVKLLAKFCVFWIFLDTNFTTNSDIQSYRGMELECKREYSPPRLGGIGVGKFGNQYFGVGALLLTQCSKLHFQKFEL